MRVFADFHHGQLYYSFVLLFEKRLGWELYCPVGYEWYKKGFWRYSSNYEVIKQYLEPNPEYLQDGIYYIPSFEGSEAYIRKAITFEKFLEMDFDFIIASVYNHELPFYRLVQEYKPEAVLIRQMGNPMEVCNFNICKNILNSTTNPVPPSINQITYHPEFSMNDYYYTDPEYHNVIKSFLNCLPMSVDAPLWYEYKSEMSDFTFKMHGILGEDGLLPEQLKAKAMRDSSFIWHLKSQGDGYGFICHCAYACGRPMIIKKSYYKNQMAEPLFIDSVTCIDLDLCSKEENIKKIRYFSRPENHIEMCRNAYKRFKELVDFDTEFVKIKDFLKKIRGGS